MVGPDASANWRTPVLVLLVAFLIVSPPFLSAYWVGLLTQVVILGILAMSLDLLIGAPGLPSLGHAGFFGVAAYGVGVLSTTYHAGFWASATGGFLIGTGLAALFGLIVSHVRDVYFLMITMALGMVLWGLRFRWIPVTGGDNGISGIPRLEGLGGVPTAGPIPFYYGALFLFSLRSARPL